MNSVVAVASLSSAAAIASPSMSPSYSLDPIFAAIERHRVATMEWLKQCDIESRLMKAIPSDKRQNYRITDRFDSEVGKDDDPRWTSSKHDYWHWCDETEEAAVQLTEVVPSTMNGVMALLAHVDDVNLARLSLDDPCQATDENHWPDSLRDEEVLGLYGRPAELSFSAWLLRNVHKALSKINGGAPSLVPETAGVSRKQQVEQTAPSADRLLDLVAAYEAAIAKNDDLASHVGLDADEDDSIYENEVLPLMYAIAVEQPTATSAEGAIAAITHVMKDEDLFGDREHGMALMALWAMLRGSRDYIAAAAASGDIQRNVKLLPMIKSVG